MNLALLFPALVAFALAFVWPKSALLVCVAVLPFQEVLGNVAIGQAQINAFDGMVMLLFATLLLRLPLALRSIRLAVVDLLVILWVLVNACTFLYNEGGLLPGLNTFRYIVAVPAAFYFLVRFSADTPRMLHRLLWVCLLSSAGLGIAGIGEFLRTHERIVTLLDAEHAGGLLMSAGALVGAYLVRVEKRVSLRMLAAACLLANLAGVVLVLSRIMLPALLVLPPLLWVLLRRARRAMPYLVLAFFAVGLLIPFRVVSYDAGVTAFEKLKDQGVDLRSPTRVLDPRQAQAAVGVRIDAYKASILFVSRSPVIGYGFGIHEKLRREGYFNLAHSHHFLLDVLLRSGAVGLLCFLGLVFSFVARCARSFPDLDADARALVTLLLSACFVVFANSLANSISNMATAAGLWLYMALAVNVCQVGRSA